MGVTAVGDGVESEVSDRPRGEFRLGLAEGAAWVAAAALAAFAVRSPRLLGDNGLPDMGQVAGLVLVPTAVVLAMALLRRVVRAEGRPAAAGVAWRLVAVAGLALFVAAQSGSLRRSPTDSWGNGWVVPVRSRLIEARLVPSCGLVSLLGLALAWSPAPRRKDARTRLGRAKAVAAAAFAGLAGVIFLAFSVGVFAALILIAVEGVAQFAPLTAGPTRSGLVARTIATLPSVGISAVACVATASWLARDLRAGPGRSPGRAEVAARLASVILAAGAALWLVVVTLPAFSPELSETFGRVIGPAEGIAVLASFAAFSAGLAARGTAPRPPSAPGSDRAFRRPGRVALVTAVAGATILTTAVALWSAYPAWPIDGLREALDFWRPMRVLSRRGTVRSAPAEILAFLFEPAAWPVIVLFGWLLAALVARALPRDRARPAALDAVWRDAATSRRFLAAWASLLVLMLAALVTLAWSGYLLAAFVHF